MRIFWSPAGNSMRVRQHHSPCLDMPSVKKQDALLHSGTRNELSRVNEISSAACTLHGGKPLLGDRKACAEALPQRWYCQTAKVTIQSGIRRSRPTTTHINPSFLRRQIQFPPEPASCVETRSKPVRCVGSSLGRRIPRLRSNRNVN